MTSFTNKKELKFVVTLKTGTFGSSNNNQITLQSFRAICLIDKVGGFQNGTMRAQIYGVSQSDMNSMTTVQWQPGYIIENKVQVFAIDGDQETLVFNGNIVNAWGNYDSMPDVFLNIQAQSAYFYQLQPVGPTSFKGQVDVATVMQQLATSMGLAFENNNVNVQLTNIYLPNTLVKQARDLAVMANCDLYIDDTVLAITNRYEPRMGLIPEISAASGLIGYPTFDGIGVTFQALFNPAVKWGGSVKLDTSITRAAGQWKVASYALRLESEKPAGAWFMQLRCNFDGLAANS